jgi:hypothetical protein
MVWAITIICVSLSCEPIPQISGWFDSEDECSQAAMIIAQSWKPDIGVYSIMCWPRSVM